MDGRTCCVCASLIRQAWFSVDAIHDHLVLLLVHLAHSRRGGRTDGPAHVASAFFVIVQLSRGRHDAGEDVRIRSHVLGFLLGPHHLGILVQRRILGNPLERKGRNLLQTDQGHICPSPVLSFGEKLVVNLARAKDQGLDVVGIFGNLGVRLVNHALRTPGQDKVSYVWQPTKMSVQSARLGAKSHEGTMALQETNKQKNS